MLKNERVTCFIQSYEEGDKKKKKKAVHWSGGDGAVDDGRYSNLGVPSISTQPAQP